ncbi:hypothetical protein [Lentzea sp. CA-135723]|uniref:hypothetical protein n=1 Tax=Lentzea sp. CA-135723 TaxID=3239950 RepID=UPI003D8B8948
MVNSAQIREPLIRELVAPPPRIGTGVLEEPPYHAHAALDRRRLQVARELLVAPALQHRCEHLLLRV